MNTSNPVFSESALEQITDIQGERMTQQGTLNKSFIMLGLVFAGAAWTWFQMSTNPNAALVMGGLGFFGGLILSFVIVFKKTWSAFLAPVYAILEGLLIGVLSAHYESRYPGLVIQAVGLTFVTFFVMLISYRLGWIRATQMFRSVLIAATLALFTFYLIALVAQFAFDFPMPLIHDKGILGIGFSVFATGLAAFNLILDFDFVEKGPAYGLPKYMEWYAAFGLTVTLVWLYIELLRLLSKFRK
ncbi:MAG TPA: Bax inhibitor-1/YccA family protein [Rhodothermales bacterium]|nr:Bax inhibitor-1/YccA family protein [Rhodothermales bacterium]